MERFRGLPGLRPGSIFIVALSLSIGWGIRGNFGHESGAMIAGVLASIAACLMSGRSDWRRRVAFFALFGGLGFGFGGSISYMYPISFAGSEQWSTCIYGFLTTFWEGLLWAGIGGMGAALPAVMERKRMNSFCLPVAFVLIVMAASALFFEPWLSETLVIPGADKMDTTWHRHHNPLYWFDADWFPALMALLGVCLFDLWDRRFSGAWRLLVYCGLGAAAGAAAYHLTGLLGLHQHIANALVIPLGDSNAINPVTGEPFGNVTFLSNWPNFVHYYPEHLGWLSGLFAGGGIYFWRYGAFRRDSKLILYLACGWLLAFILMPTLGSIPLQSIGGFRMTPPRSDDWAGITGVFVAGMLYCLRYGLGGAAFSGSVTGLVGGFFFIAVPFLRALLRIPGHPYRTPGGMPDTWAHYQNANWHSIMEQLHGFGHGIALAIALGMLAGMVKPHDDQGKRHRGAEMFGIIFVLFFVTLMNVFKNVGEWTQGSNKVVPAIMKAPLFSSIEFPAEIWFLFAWAALATSVIALMLLHLRRPLPIVPASWRARSQILYLAFLWIMVIANFERALPGFQASRLVTEWVIIMNAALATFLIIALPRSSRKFYPTEPVSYSSLLLRLWLRAFPAIVCAVFFMAIIIRVIYGDAPLDSPDGNHKRWGDEARWRTAPILMNVEHR